MPPSGQTGRQRHNILNLFIRSFVTIVVNTIFWKWINRR